MRPFSYARPVDLAAALSAVQRPGVKLLGGGTNLLDLMKMGVERPEHLVDVTRLPLDGIEERGGALRLGAGARNSDVADHALVRRRYRALSQALVAGASPQIRNMATVGGNLMQRTRCYYFYDPSFAQCNKRAPGSGCAALTGYHRIHAILGGSEQCIATHPSDMAVALAMFGATVEIAGPQGGRTMPIAELHRLPGATPQIESSLGPDDIITAVELPPLAYGWRSHYLKVRDRASYAFALVSVAAALDLADSGVIREARLALGGVAPKPWRVPAAERALVGRRAEAAAFGAAADALLAGATPRRHNRFKVELARASIVRALSVTAALG